MEFCLYRSNATIEKISRKASSFYRFQDQANGYYKQMQVMNIGQQLFLKKLMAKEVFVGIKFVYSSFQNYTTTLLSKKSLQLNMGLKNSNFIFLGIIF